MIDSRDYGFTFLLKHSLVNSFDHTFTQQSTMCQNLCLVPGHKVKMYFSLPWSRTWYIVQLDSQMWKETIIAIMYIIYFIMGLEPMWLGLEPSQNPAWDLNSCG